MRESLRVVRGWLGRRPLVVSLMVHLALLCMAGVCYRGVGGGAVSEGAGGSYFKSFTVEEETMREKMEAHAMADPLQEEERGTVEPDVARDDVTLSQEAGVMGAMATTGVAFETEPGLPGAHKVGGEKPSGFFGLRTKEESIVFVVDVSGSMLEKAGKLNRLEIAFDELKRSVSGLESHQKFNIILFGSVTAGFQPRPVLANGETISRAVQFLNDDHDLGGSTNMELALMEALRMKADSIVVLSDGEPNDNAEKVLQRVRAFKATQRQDTRIHAIGFFLQPRSKPEKFLTRLVSEHGGSYLRWSRHTGLASVQQP